MYFWRNSVRTLFEIRSAIEILYGEDEFRNALESQPLPLQDAFKSLKDEIVKASWCFKTHSKLDWRPRFATGC